MRMLDRFVLSALALGIWLLVAVLIFQPSKTIAHPDPEDCSGTGYGEIEDLSVGGSVYVYTISLSC